MTNDGLEILSSENAYLDYISPLCDITKTWYLEQHKLQTDLYSKTVWRKIHVEKLSLDGSSCSKVINSLR